MRTPPLLLPAIGVVFVILNLPITLVFAQQSCPSDYICPPKCDRRSIDLKAFEIREDAEAIHIEIPVLFKFKLDPVKLQHLSESTRELNTYFKRKAEAHNSCSGNTEEYGRSIDRMKNLQDQHGLILSLIATIGNQSEGANPQDVEKLGELLEEFFRGYLKIMRPGYADPVISPPPPIKLLFKRLLINGFTVSNVANEPLRCAFSLPDGWLGTPQSATISSGQYQDFRITFWNPELLGTVKDILKNTGILNCGSPIGPAYKINLELHKKEIRPFFINIAKTPGLPLSEWKSAMVEGFDNTEKRLKVYQSIDDVSATLSLAAFQQAAGNSAAALATYGTIADKTHDLRRVENAHTAIYSWRYLAESQGEKTSASKANQVLKVLNLNDESKPPVHRIPGQRQPEDERVLYP